VDGSDKHFESGSTKKVKDPAAAFECGHEAIIVPAVAVQLQGRVIA